MIFSAINDDCVGDPPGELMIKATAGLFLSANNLSINLSKVAILKPDRKKPV